MGADCSYTSCRMPFINWCSCEDGSTISGWRHCKHTSAHNALYSSPLKECRNKKRVTAVECACSSCLCTLSANASIQPFLYTSATFLLETFLICATRKKRELFLCMYYTLFLGLRSALAFTNSSAIIIR